MEKYVLKNEKYEAKDCIIQAMFLLLEKYSIDDISITMLCSKAGVSRITFYRNFDKKEDVIFSYYKDNLTKWWEQIVDQFKNEAMEEYFYELLLKHLLKYKSSLMLLKKNNLLYIIKNCIFDSGHIDLTMDDNEAYKRAGLLGQCSAIIEQWIIRGMNQIPPIHKLITYDVSN